jgi:hypothetical protein
MAGGGGTSPRKSVRARSSAPAARYGRARRGCPADDGRSRRPWRCRSAALGAVGTCPGATRPPGPPDGVPVQAHSASASCRPRRPRLCSRPLHRTRTPDWRARTPCRSDYAICLLAPPFPGRSAFGPSTRHARPNPSRGRTKAGVQPVFRQSVPSCACPFRIHFPAALGSTRITRLLRYYGGSDCCPAG